MPELLGLSVQMFFVAVVMLGASVAMRQPLLPEYGVRRGDADIYAVSGGIIIVIAGLLALLAAAPIPIV